MKNNNDVRKLDTTSPRPSEPIPATRFNTFSDWVDGLADELRGGARKLAENGIHPPPIVVLISDQPTKLLDLKYDNAQERVRTMQDVSAQAKERNASAVIWVAVGTFHRDGIDVSGNAILVSVLGPTLKTKSTLQEFLVSKDGYYWIEPVVEPGNLSAIPEWWTKDR